MIYLRYVAVITLVGILLLMCFCLLDFKPYECHIANNTKRHAVMTRTNTRMHKHTHAQMQSYTYILACVASTHAHKQTHMQTHIYARAECGIG